MIDDISIFINLNPTIANASIVTGIENATNRNRVYMFDSPYTYITIEKQLWASN